ncbi:MAG TPA: S-methyl-5-thioribose-1-phosphate isomerase, partial [Firmicutes bacterium]|nr:S-methyl-5-thioribose-1-phosphate isomerase [Bacillota bacterium]
AFDLTPASLVSAIITEKGVIYKEEYENKLAYYNDLKIKG